MVPIRVHDAPVRERIDVDPAPSRTRVRWVVCALLFFAITINYVDRQIIGVLKPTLAEHFGWQRESTYANIVFVFQLCYAVGLLISGWVIDRIGVKAGLALAVGIWSIAAAAHGLAASVPLGLAVVYLSAARGLLGLSEAGAFPASIRATAEWFPKSERGLATGLFNAGSNIGAIATPLIVPLIVRVAGWPTAFYVTGALGLLWLAVWLVAYRRPDDHPGVSAAELAHIRSDPPDPAEPVPWRMLLRYRATWAFAVGKFFTDPIWWFYLFWIPGFLHDRYQLDLQHFGPPLVVIYLMADVGSVGGGWLSGALIRRRFTPPAARRRTMLLCAVAVLPVLAVSRTANQWTATLLIGLAAAAHQAWSANLFTSVSDAFPRKAVARVVGLGGMAGAVGGMLIAKFIGAVLDATDRNYFYPFLLAGLAYLVAFALMQLILIGQPRRGEG